MRIVNAQDIRRMSTFTAPADIEAIIAGGFKQTTALVFVEACGSAPRSASGVLARDENCDLWVSALMHVRSNLAKSLGSRFLAVGADEGDGDFRRFRSNLREVERRLPQACDGARRMRRRVAEERMGQLPAEEPDGPGMAALLRAHQEEYRELLRGAGPAPELLEDGRFDPEWAARAGALKAPASRDVQDLARSHGDGFCDRVADDVHSPGGTEPALRHPMLLTRWGRALEVLAEDTARKLERPPDTELPVAEGLLPVEVWLDLPAGKDEARKMLNRFRFAEAVAERRFEQSALLERACGDSAYGVERQRRSRRRRAREELRSRYEPEYAMYEALA